LDRCRNIVATVSPGGRFARKLRDFTDVGERKSRMFGHLYKGSRA
jgi:hypothetical protein